MSFFSLRLIAKPVAGGGMRPNGDGSSAASTSYGSFTSGRSPRGLGDPLRPGSKSRQVNPVSGRIRRELGWGRVTHDRAAESRGVADGRVR